MLVELIGNRAAPDADDMEGVCAAGQGTAATNAGQGALGKAECASMARLMLTLILELFGAQALSSHHYQSQPCASMIWSGTFQHQDSAARGKCMHCVWPNADTMLGMAFGLAICWNRATYATMLIDAL